ncbi:iron-containing alcohol dehydrogenase [Candidimonas humi]|uniref:Iron-containing alcohol dehydrogenase family protein n=1 Tax=Candidimonas humi TaxID=683355 RepID=A0ABV8P2W8_9BURK|nr:iron-containing alcohol dehydrogenase [Candidimonas humi]MBV6306100.1 iron-containing alcohol dehydrogenase [Candidimonas humi]
MDAPFKMHFPPQLLLRGNCAELLNGLGGQRVLVIGSKRSAELFDWAGLFPGKEVAIFDGSLPHSPEAVLAQCSAIAHSFSPDTLIAIGSGSAIDLAKGVLDSISAEFIAIPTSLGGGEMTNVYGIRTQRGTKEGKGGLKYLPKKVIYDPGLLASLPLQELAASGINSWAHCIEAFYSRKQHWFGKAAAARGGNMWPELLTAAKSGEQNQALAETLFEAASLAGFAINACGLGLHHAVCHVVGAATGLTHGLVNAIALPKTLALNREIAPAAIRATEQALSVDDLIQSASDLIARLELPRSLQELHVSMDLVEPLVKALMTAHHLKNNPAVLDEDHASKLMHAIFTGST